MKKALGIDLEYMNEDDLTSVYFDLGNYEYFTLAREEDDEKIYVEYNDQAYGTYTTEINFVLEKERISFSFSDNLKKEINSDDHLEIQFELPNKKFSKLEKTLLHIFAPVL